MSPTGGVQVIPEEVVLVIRHGVAAQGEGIEWALGMGHVGRVGEAEKGGIGLNLLED